MLHEHVKRSREWVRERPFIFLVTVQILLLFADTVLDRNGGNTLVSGFLLGVFVLAVRAALQSVRMPPGHLGGLGAAAVLLRVGEYYASNTIVTVLFLLVYAAFHLTLVLVLLRYALRRDHHTTSSKLMAVSAAYIAFPQFWTALFLLIQKGDPHAFNPGAGLEAPLNFQDMLYFSYNVFTTVDISNTLPASRVAMTTVVLAEIVAQLFVVIFIARLVGVFPAEPRNTPKSKDSLNRPHPSND